jgi:hypothetical protein
MTIAVVQTVKSNTSTTTIAGTGSGNTLVVTINSSGTSGPSITSVKLGTTALTLAVDNSFSSINTFSSWVYYLDGVSSGQTSVAITGSGLGLTSGSGGVCVYEIAGLASASNLDKTNSGNNSTSSYSSGSSGTLSQAAEIAIGTAVGTGPSSPSGFTNTTDSGAAWISGYKIVSATTAQTYSGTLSSSDWAACIATFKGLSNVSVALNTATNTIAAYPPGVAAGPIQLASATVAVAAHPVTPSAGKSVALATATVSIAAYAPGLASGPVQLQTATVNLAAPAPVATVKVVLSTATVAIAAHSPSIPRTVPLDVAAVNVAAYPVTVAVITPKLVFSIASSSGTDEYGYPYVAGIAAYGPDGQYAALNDASLVFQAFTGQYQPAFIEPNGDNYLVMNSGLETSGDASAVIQVGSQAASGYTGGVAQVEAGTIQLTSTGSGILLEAVGSGTINLQASSVEVNGNQINNLSTPLGYPLSGSATNAQIVACLNSLISGFITAGIIS